MDSDTDFFTQHDRFEKTGYASGADRLNRRYDAIIQDNIDIIRGSRILDLASHDARWSFAGLKAGAEHVTGIEARQELIDVANENMAFYDTPKDSYDFIQGDVPGAMHDFDKPIDVVFLLGFFYHTMKHSEIFEAIEKIGAKHIIIDSNVMKLEGVNPNIPAIIIGRENSANPLNAVSDQERVLVGIPTKKAILIMLDSFGYDCKIYDWSAITPHQSIQQYTKETRMTVVGTKR